MSHDCAVRTTCSVPALMDVAPLRMAFADVAAWCGAAALVVRRGDEVLVDEAVGDAHAPGFASTTPVFLYSAVKPMAALTVLVAAADGALDLDAPVADVWPAFAAHGKDAVTVATALAHGAAVPGWRTPVTVADLADVVAAAEALVTAPPWWTPGEPGEHAVSYGHLLDGILRHATGAGIADWWPRAVAACGVPLDLTAGSGDREPAPLVDPGGAWRDTWVAADGAMGALLRNPVELLDVDVVNAGPVRRLVAPAVTGYGSAHDLAALWSWWCSDAADTRLGPDLHRRAVVPELRGPDHVLGREVAWALGPQVDDDGSIGMGGVGGCVGWYDPVLGLAIGITTPIVGPLDRLDPIDDAIATMRADRTMRAT